MALVVSGPGAAIGVAESLEPSIADRSQAHSVDRYPACLRNILELCAAYLELSKLEFPQGSIAHRDKGAAPPKAWHHSKVGVRDVSVSRQTLVGRECERFTKGILHSLPRPPHVAVASSTFDNKDLPPRGILFKERQEDGMHKRSLSRSATGTPTRAAHGSKRTWEHRRVEGLLENSFYEHQRHQRRQNLPCRFLCKKPCFDEPICRAYSHLCFAVFPPK